MNLCTCDIEEREHGVSAGVNATMLSALNRDLNRRPMYEYRCDERLKGQAEGSTRLVYTGLRGGD